MQALGGSDPFFRDFVEEPPTQSTRLQLPRSLWKGSRSGSKLGRHEDATRCRLLAAQQMVQAQTR